LSATWKAFAFLRCPDPRMLRSRKCSAASCSACAGCSAPCRGKRRAGARRPGRGPSRFLEPAGAQSSSCGPDQEAGRLSRGLLAPRRSAPARQRPGRPRAPVRLRRSSAARVESPLAAPRWTPRRSPEAPLRRWHRGSDPRALRVAPQARRARAATPLSPGPLSQRVRSGIGLAEPDLPRPEENKPRPSPAANTRTLPPETTARGETSRIPWAELSCASFGQTCSSVLAAAVAWCSPSSPRRRW
jgi:hypothetical protein